jgi:hypothetical protein
MLAGRIKELRDCHGYGLKIVVGRCKEHKDDWLDFLRITESWL